MPHSTSRKPFSIIVKLQLCEGSFPHPPPAGSCRIKLFVDPAERILFYFCWLFEFLFSLETIQRYPYSIEYFQDIYILIRAEGAHYNRYLLISYLLKS